MRRIGNELMRSGMEGKDGKDGKDGKEGTDSAGGVDCKPAGEFADLTGVIVAGGRSRRMGSDKALLPFRGEPLIAAVHAVLQPLCGEVLIVARNPAPYAFLSARGVRDILAAEGPLIGIHAGLVASRSEWAIVVGCDMPLLQTGLLRYLIGLRGGWDAVVPQRSAGFEPLHALYARSCRRPIENAVAGGGRRVSAFFDTVRVRSVVTRELRRHDPELHSLRNVNTPAELAALAASTLPNGC